jgi:hypothetical protein
MFDLPQPDDRGVFSFGARLGEAPSHLNWDSALARAWLPLDTWVHEFLSPQVGNERAMVSRSMA